MPAETSDAFRRGWTDCAQDACENAPFASIGGLGARDHVQAPRYVPEADRAEWVRGYEAAALAAYGADWRTCSFGWRPAIVLPGNAVDGASAPEGSAA